MYNFNYNIIVKIKYNYDSLKERIEKILLKISDYQVKYTTFKLKKEYKNEYNPFYICEHNEEIEEININNNTIKPFKILPHIKIYDNIFNIINCKEYNNIIKSNLLYFNKLSKDENNSIIFTILQPTLWMIIIELNNKKDRKSVV